MRGLLQIVSGLVLLIPVASASQELGASWRWNTKNGLVLQNYVGAESGLRIFSQIHSGQNMFDERNWKMRIFKTSSGQIVRVETDQMSVVFLPHDCALTLGSCDFEMELTYNSTSVSSVQEFTKITVLSDGVFRTTNFLSMAGSMYAIGQSCTAYREDAEVLRQIEWGQDGVSMWILPEAEMLEKHGLIEAEQIGSICGIM